jgi:hypothetical protein
MKALSRKSDPQSSYIAAAGVNVSAHQLIIIAVLNKANKPLTNHEIASRCNLSYSQVARRTGEIAYKGANLRECSSGLPRGKVCEWSLNEN